MTKSRKGYHSRKAKETCKSRKPFSKEDLFKKIITTYNTNRKALAKDREGIRIKISSYNNGNITLNDNTNIGNYSVEVLSNQLIQNNNILKFKCCVHNDRKDVILLTAVSLLDACSLTSCNDGNFNSMTEDFVEIGPKTIYDNIIIKFQIDEPVITSYQIPLALNLIEQNGKRNITICRTILLNIVNSKNQSTSQELKKSPFTGKPFRYKYIKELYTRSKEDYTGSKHCEFEFAGKELDKMKILETLERTNAKQTTLKYYADKFHNCLWLEEITCKEMLEKYNMENVTMKLVGEQLKLEVPGLEQKRPRLVIGDKIHIAVHGDHTAYKGYISKIEGSYIFIKNLLSELLEVISYYPNMELDVSFQLGELPLERAHQGIKGVCERGTLKSLFSNSIQCSSKGPKRKIYDFDNQKVIKNNEQRTAVENILNCTSGRAPYIVYGPPGTGKTVTIVEAIYQILKNTTKKILVCAPSNAACDMLTTKLIKFCNRNQLIRVHSEARDKTTIPEEIRSYSNFSSEDEVGRMPIESLITYRIVVTTLILIGRYSNADTVNSEPKCEFDHIFIDEAGQATEPDTCVALALLKPNGHIVLAGDPKQLGPIVLSTDAQEHGLDISLLERLMTEQRRYVERNPLFITMLKNNFRSHADILHIPNKLFYSSELRAVSEAAQNHPVSKFDIYSNIKMLQAALEKDKHRYVLGSAIEFIGVSSKERRQGQTPSYFNESEATMVIECVRTLMESHSMLRIRLSDIGVISPYIRQVYKIKELLQKNNFKDVEVGSTEAFQGREKRVIIISTVRAKHELLLQEDDYNLGFVKDSRRFNVALTRAMSKLIVIGCPIVLSTDSKWKEFIEECASKASYHGFPLEERTREKMNDIINRFTKFPVLFNRE